MRAASLSTFLTIALASTAFADSQPATLAGHVVIPAATFIPAPTDAPDDLKISGKFTTGKRIDTVGTVEGRSRGRPTGVKLPFNGQPVQGQFRHQADARWHLLGADRQRFRQQGQLA